MIVFSIWVGLFGWLANFDAAFGGIVLLMPPYQQAFGQCVPDGSGSETCSLTALQQSLIQLTVLFMAVGGFVSGIVGGYAGRRGTLQLGCLLIAVGAAGMIGSAGTFTGYLASKCVGGVGIGMIYSAAPTWGSESVAPQKRGFLMSFYNVGLASGNVVAAAVGFCLPLRAKRSAPLTAIRAGVHGDLQTDDLLGVAGADLLPDPGGGDSRRRQHLLLRVAAVAPDEGQGGEGTAFVC